MLTPIDIENKEFSRVFRGYEQAEVDEFMRTLLTDYEKLYRENGSLKDKNDMLTDTLNNYKGMESTMQNAILMAQKTAEDIKQSAYRTRDTIVKEAEIKAKGAIGDAEKKIDELEKKYRELQHEMNAFKARMSSLLSTYMSLLSENPQEKNRDSDIIFKRPEYASPEKEKASGNYSKTEKNELKNDAVPKEERPDTGYKKINPVVDELLKKRESENASGGNK